MDRVGVVGGGEMRGGKPMTGGRRGWWRVWVSGVTAVGCPAGSPIGSSPQVMEVSREGAVPPTGWRDRPVVAGRSSRVGAGSQGCGRRKAARLPPVTPAAPRIRSVFWFAYLVIAGRRSCHSGTSHSSPHYLEDFGRLCVHARARVHVGAGRVGCPGWLPRARGCRARGMRAARARPL